jgi:hypothetical protein
MTTSSVITCPPTPERSGHFTVHSGAVISRIPDTPAAQALTETLGAIESRAQFGPYVHDVHVRIAGHDGAVYLDLADDAWRAVEITRDGWRLIVDPPVKFRRPKGMLALPAPTTGGTLDGLREFLNLRDGDQYALVIGWLVAAARPRGPYPVLVLGGEHGAAKSTTAEVFRRLIDPNAAMLRAKPRDVRDVMIAASNGWIVALDNLSDIESWLSDALCRLATGGGFATRELYSDTDEIIFDAQRPVILNGIEEIVTRSDLLDRGVLLDLPAIEETRRRHAREFWATFAVARPRLLGALLDAVACSLAREDTVKLPRLPRMADFALTVTAASPALGWSDHYFLGIYDANRGAAHEIALDASPIAASVCELAGRGNWRGTASELLSRLSEIADETTRKARGWPENGRAMSGALRRIVSNLRQVGVGVVFGLREARTGRRLIEIGKTKLSTVTTVTTATSAEDHGVTVDGGATENGALGRLTGNMFGKYASAFAGDDGDDRDDGIPARSIEVPKYSALPSGAFPGVASCRSSVELASLMSVDDGTPNVAKTVADSKLAMEADVVATRRRT